MTIAEMCTLVSCLLPIVCAGIAKSMGFGRPRREGGFDNNHPRQWLASLAGWQARAHAAQQNSFEALPIFIAGVLIAERLHAPQTHVDDLALLFIAARIGYIGTYLANWATARSIVWVIGLGASIGLYFI
ncbi:MAG: MAPEG family protein [Rhodanobacter sp.]